MTPRAAPAYSQRSKIFEENPMPIWRGLPVALQPGVILDCWQIIRAPDGCCHILGRHSAGIEVRVWSPLVAFDPKGLRARTRSGRTYQPIGDSMPSRDTDYVLAGWCIVNEIDFDALEFVGLDALSDLPGLE